MTDNPFPPIAPLHLPDQERRLQAAAARVTHLRRRRAALSVAALVAVIAGLVLPLTLLGGSGRPHHLQVVGGPATTASPASTASPSSTASPATTASPTATTAPEVNTPSPSTPTSSQRTHTGPAGSTSPTVRPGGVTGAVPMCGSASAVVSIGQPLAALGHDGRALVFRNQGPAPCALSGYPGVAGLTATGAQAAQATRTPSGYLGGLGPGQTVPPEVVLSPGQAASALVESTDNPTGTATTCPQYPSLLVTPPNTTHTVELSMGTSPLRVCSTFQVHPVVPGMTGTASGPSSPEPPFRQPQLLTALQTTPFPQSGLPDHLHVTGVGPWQYVDPGHVGSGYIGSAQVFLTSDLPGEQISDNYDVFTTAADASASFSAAYSNFHSEPGFVTLTLNPSVRAFCGPQTSPLNTTCWFTRGTTNGIVTATVPSRSSTADNQAVLQAMLTHLVALGG